MGEQSVEKSERKMKVNLIRVKVKKSENKGNAIKIMQYHPKDQSHDQKINRIKK